WSVSEIAEAVNGKIVKWGSPGTICTDTRSLNTSTIAAGQWFFAITGENFDGHDFITSDLYSKGCVGVIGNKVCENWEWGFVKLQEEEDDCQNTLIALEKMGIYARNKFKGNVVGVTGSVGKTTTRTMIAIALENLGLVHQTNGNQNNQIGVALTMIGIPGNAQVAVVEMGMRRKGEILKLAGMCRPSIGVILNVEPAHLENFGCLKEIANAKGEILKEMKPGDICVMNADDPLVMSLPVPLGVKKVLFGRRMGSDVRLVVAENTNGGYGVRVVLERNTEMVEFVIQSPGLHLALNACAAAAVSGVLGVSLPEFAYSLPRFTPVNMRSELDIAENGVRIINDTYNANPTSTKAAISLLKGIECRGKRVAILGDMLELGPAEVEAHETVLSLCCVASIDMVALVGKKFISAAEKLKLSGTKKVICSLDSEALALQIAESINKDDVVLVKGSRSMKMETIVDAIKAIPLEPSV
ncbi:hypothetical protein AQUCO_03500048v1, partial [Aquilegia coerulea]